MWPIPRWAWETGRAWEAIAAERARIARDLHDSVDRSLHGIALAAASLAGSFPSQRDPADAAPPWPRLLELAGLARHAIAETRRVSYDLRDDPAGAPLCDVVRDLATAWSADSGVAVSLAVPSGTDVAGDNRREIVAILRESLRNVEMHAHATQVRVSLRRAAQRLLLTVSDNGGGFTCSADPRDLRASARYGLIGMTERARKLGGTLVIRSRAGHGTRIAVQVPAADTPP